MMTMTKTTTKNINFDNNNGTVDFVTKASSTKCIEKDPFRRKRS